jgi:hypothetical protein
MKWTKGPWNEDMIGAVYRRGCVKYHNQLMVEVRGGDVHNEEECAANAHLIASAPELYEALNEIYNMLCQRAMPNYDDQWWNEARGALAKARGEV